MPPEPHSQRSTAGRADASAPAAADLANSSQPAAAGPPQPQPGDAWWQTGVVYQIYPRSFADANGDGVGDLAGIIDRLDHLAGSPDSLGVDAIWLSPIYPSPDFDFGYDVADYVGVDRRYGSLADFERLVKGAHERGLRVILDLVLNHSSSQHAWFRASRESRQGPYADWYIWRDSPGRSLLGRRRPPNNWRSFFGGSAWTWDERREQFYLHTFLPEQPDLNWRHPPAREALLGVVQAWLDRGVDGFRLDVFNSFFKEASLRSNPRRIGRRGRWSWQRHLYDRDQPELRGAIDELRALVDAKPGRMTVGELFDGSIADAAGFVAPRHLIFDWSMISLPWNAGAFRTAIERRDGIFGPGRWPANVLSNHDQPRHASRYDAPGPKAPADGFGDARAKVAATMLLTLRGTPFLYYGEEIGLRNLAIPNRQALDPPARRASWLFPWWNRDQARGPMPWSRAAGGGFTSGKPWLPLPPDAATRNVSRESSDPASILRWYRALLGLRRETPALHQGAQELLDSRDPDVLAYVRDPTGNAGASSATGRPGAAASSGLGHPPGSVFVALNFATRAAVIRTPARASGGAGPWRLRCSTEPDRPEGPLGESVELAPLEAIVAVAS
ncbi:MAG TPA: alpha-glucosidase [Candidatus Limnocylindria bacterium]|nr:alpha-glucosidase [Candidatus Limnocylindria bacterium]